jgi:ribosomal protein S18 acetylase RimI-like enzyme
MIRALASDDEARRCAGMMCATDPWITIGRDFEDCLIIVQKPGREVYVAEENGTLGGFVIVDMKGAFIGYIAILCVDASRRSSGIGSRLIRFAEERIFAETPNAFICASSFNPRARALYERLGYKPVGELADYVIPGHHELLMRKTIGPLRGFHAPGQPRT